jgi:thiol-disulfide isomerase/thioredoxin
MSPLPVITKINRVKDFQDLLEKNPGLIIIKFGAAWCGPCKMIEQPMYILFAQMPENVQPVLIDVDECVELYSFMRNKRIFKGVPALLCYYAENTSPYPDDMVIGADIPQLNLFFQRCFHKATELLS